MSFQGPEIPKSICVEIFRKLPAYLPKRSRQLIHACCALDIFAFSRLPVCFTEVLERGEGSWVYTTDGEKYLDFSTGPLTTCVWCL